MVDNESSSNPNANHDGKDDGAEIVDQHDNHLKELRINPYIIFADPHAFDASGWSLDQIKEYQRLREKNRDEAEETYNLACTQLNTLIAISGIVLSIVVSCMYASDESYSFLIVVSCCFIASSLIISAYSSLKTRYVSATYVSGSDALVWPHSLDQLMISDINITLSITKSHADYTELKRKALDCAMVLFIIGICLLVLEQIVQAFIL